MPMMKVNVEPFSSLWFDCADADGWLEAKTDQAVSTFEEFKSSVRSTYCQQIRDGTIPEPYMLVTGNFLPMMYEGSYCFDR
jgi:hypothetical protein